MRKYWPTLLLLFPLVLLLAAGCGKQADEEDEGIPYPPKGRRSAVKVRTPLEAVLGGTIKGRVIFDGTPPAVETQPGYDTHPDCRAAPEEQQIRQSWIVGNDGGVANVVVYLKAPRGKYFKYDPATMKPKDDAEMDQPFCTFIPHVLACFPAYPEFNEEEKKVEDKLTGQQILVKNSATGIIHNSRYTSSSGIGGNPILLPNGKEDLTEKVKPGLFSFNCSYHTWMTAYIWVFDHPYSYVTAKDGNFELKNVPLDVDLDLVIWHEAKGNFKTEKIKLKKGETTPPLNFKIQR